MAQAETITSAANPLVKDVRRAVAQGGLTRQGWWVAETFHLLEEALRGPCAVKTVLAAESARPAVEAHFRRLAGIPAVVLPDALFRSVSATETSQGVMALVEPPAWSLNQLFGPEPAPPVHAAHRQVQERSCEQAGDVGCPLVVVLDGLQDPGNAGAIVRAAEAFGATGVLFLRGTASPYNPKTLRASAGSLFRVPFVHGVEAEAARAALREQGVALFAAMPAAGGPWIRPLGDTDLTGRAAVVIGSEAHGVGSAFGETATGVSIPTAGVESLNAAVAAGILLYEARRQRDRRP